MDFNTMSDKAIQKEIGLRFKALRLQRNISQEDLALSVGCSDKTIKSLEAGNGKLPTMIAVLRELGSLDQLSNFIPEILISPMDLAKRQGQIRLRASGKRTTSTLEEEGEKW